MKPEVWIKGGQVRQYMAKTYEMDGEVLPLGVWCKRYRKKYGTTYNRIHRHGWSLKKALETPPLWVTNGQSEEPVVGTKNSLEQDLNGMKLEELPRKFQHLVRTVGYKGSTPYSGTHYGRFLREACKKEFDAYWKHYYKPKQRADFYHDKYTRENQSKIGAVGANPEGSGNPKPVSGSNPAGGSELLRVADRLNPMVVMRPTGDSLLFCR